MVLALHHPVRPVSGAPCGEGTRGGVPNGYGSVIGGMAAYIASN